MKIENQLRELLRSSHKKRDQSTAAQVGTVTKISPQKKQHQFTTEQNRQNNTAENRWRYAEIEQYIPRAEYMASEESLSFRGSSLTLAEIRAQRAIGLYGQQLKFQYHEDIRSSLSTFEDRV